MRTSLALVVLAGMAAWAAPGDNILRNGSFEVGTQSWAAPGQAAIVPCELPGHPKALRLALNPEPGGNPWSITMVQGLSARWKRSSASPWSATSAAPPDPSASAGDPG